jgi:hypothetical protein
MAARTSMLAALRTPFPHSNRMLTLPLPADSFAPTPHAPLPLQAAVMTHAAADAVRCLATASASASAPAGAGEAPTGVTAAGAGPGPGPRAGAANGSGEGRHGNAATGSAPAHGERILWVKKESDPAFAALELDASIKYVGQLTEAIVKKLPSLAVRDLSTLTLHVAQDTAGAVTSNALDSTEAVDEALRKVLALPDVKDAGTAKIRIVVKVAGGAVAAQPASPAEIALAAWRGVLPPSASVDDVRASAGQVAATALMDCGLSVADEARMWKSPAAQLVLKRPLPFDTSNQGKASVMLELMEAVGGGPGVARLHERMWHKLQPAFKSTVQRTSLVLLTGTSGAGKTKAAFDIGRDYAFLLLTRVFENGVLTHPWRLLAQVTEQLRVQSVSSTGSALPAVPAESSSAVAAILVLLSCQLEWAVAVYDAAKAKIQEGSADERVLREVVLRAQRNGIGYDSVAALFATRMRDMLADPNNITPDGRVSFSVDSAMRRLKEASSGLPSSMPTVWCYDEVQVLLTDIAFPGFFAGSFNAAAFQSFSGAAVPASREGNPAQVNALTTATETNGISASRVAAATELRFSALPDDISANAGELRRSCSRGWFYGLLVAVRHMVHGFPWGHILCGSSLRVDRELLMAHSPAQGVSDSADADVRLDAATVRHWFEAYLTPAAAAGLDDALIARLVGRPLFASCFFQQLYSMLDETLPAELSADPRLLVHTALGRAVNDATETACKRVGELWGASFMTARGMQPQTLVAWLYYMQRMGWGTATAITPPTMSSEVMDAVQMGVLHVRRNDRVIDLADEPITADAILAVGEARTCAVGTFAEDSVLRALARRVTGPFGDDSAKGSTAEDVLAWTLLRNACGQRMPLRELLSPFLAGPPELFPASLADHTVHLTGGLACSGALGTTGAERTFLELFDTPGGEGLLLHRAQPTAAGADLAFLAQRPGATRGASPRQRLVLLQVRNAAHSTVAQMLPTVDLGAWYPDIANAASPETLSHAALRRVLVAHPDWSDPVRVLVSSRPWAPSTQLTAACMSWVKVPAQPVLLAQLRKDNIGVDIAQARSGAQLRPPKEARKWWPTRVRHWPADSLHPQADLPQVPIEAVQQSSLLPSARVRFTAVNGATTEDLLRAATSGDSYTVLEQREGSLLVEFNTTPVHLGALRAMQRVERARAVAESAHTPSPYVVAEFVH